MSGLIEVKLAPEENSPSIRLTAIGTPPALASLKHLLRQYSGNHWLYHCGRPFNRSAKYFMSGAEVLVFARGCNDDGLVSFDI